MADERGDHQPFEPLPGWPSPPEGEPAPDPGAAPARPPSAPPPGWTGSLPPWAEPAGSGGRVEPAGSGGRAEPAGSGGRVEPAGDRPWPPRREEESRPGRLAGLGGRRRLAIATGALLLLVGAGVGVAVVSSGDDEGAPVGASGGGRSSSVPAAAAGSDIPLLEGRLVVTALPGWEQRESSPSTATMKLELRLPGRELLATLVVAALPGAGSLDPTLTVDGGSRFEVAAGGGPIQATAVPASGNVRAGTVRPSGSFLLSLSVFAMDGNGLDAPTLQKLFTEQVAPQLRFS